MGCWEIQGAPSGLGCKVLRSHGRQAAQAFLSLPIPPSSLRFLSLPSQCSFWYFFIPLSLPLISSHPQTWKKPRQCLALWRTHRNCKKSLGSGLCSPACSRHALGLCLGKSLNCSEPKLAPLYSEDVMLQSCLKSHCG